MNQAGGMSRSHPTKQPGTEIGMTYKYRKILYNRLTIPYRPFYKRHPYRGMISINSADDRGCVDMSMGFFYNRIPKAANSTVMINLAKARFGTEIDSREAKRRFSTPSRLSKEEVERFDDLFKFTVVRNPYTRLLSAYLEKIEKRAKLKGSDSSFRDFIFWLKSGGLEKNAHWATMQSLLLIPADSFNFIGKMENLSNDLPFIFRHISPDFTMEFKSRSEHATNASDKLTNYYSPDLIALTKDIYRNDFDIFQYSSDLPV